MTEQERKTALHTNRLPLSFGEKISHFGIVIFLSIIPLMLIFFHLKDAFNNIPISLKEDEIYVFIIPIFSALIFYKVQSHKLIFKVIYTPLLRTQLADIIKSVGHELEWHPEEISDNIVVIKTHPPFLSGSWGEQVTILFDSNRILVNSICDPDRRSSIVSMGRNTKNVNRLVEEVEIASR